MSTEEDTGPYRRRGCGRKMLRTDPTIERARVVARSSAIAGRIGPDDRFLGVLIQLAYTENA